MVDYWFRRRCLRPAAGTGAGFLTAAAPKKGTDVRASFAEQVTIEQFAGFAKPVLVVYGDASPPVAPATVRVLVGFMPSARLHVLPGATHGMLDSHAGALADLIPPWIYRRRA